MLSAFVITMLRVAQENKNSLREDLWLYMRQTDKGKWNLK